MPEPSLSIITADEEDLPRTIRREREARDREAREKAPVTPVVPTGPTMPTALEHSGGNFRLPAPSATVTAFDVPFGKLMKFFIKAVFAAIPAMLLLTALLWLFGQGLQSAFPQLVKMKVLIYVPQ
jgi:hypothetical protein